MRKCDEDSGSSGNWRNSLPFTCVVGRVTIQRKQWFFLFFFLGNYILPSYKEKWCQAWVWCCLRSVLCVGIYPRPLAARRVSILACGWGPVCSDTEPCDRSANGDRGPSVSTRTGALSLWEAAALSETALAGEEPDSGVGTSAQVQLSDGLSFNLLASVRCFSHC